MKTTARMVREWLRRDYGDETECEVILDTGEPGEYEGPYEIITHVEGQDTGTAQLVASLSRVDHEIADDPQPSLPLAEPRSRQILVDHIRRYVLAQGPEVVTVVLRTMELSKHVRVELREVPGPQPPMPDDPTDEEITPWVDQWLDDEKNGRCNKLRGYGALIWRALLKALHLLNARLKDEISVGDVSNIVLGESVDGVLHAPEWARDMLRHQFVDGGIDYGRDSIRAAVLAVLGETRPELGLASSHPRPSGGTLVVGPGARAPEDNNYAMALQFFEELTERDLLAMPPYSLIAQIRNLVLLTRAALAKDPQERGHDLGSCKRDEELGIHRTFVLLPWENAFSLATEHYQGFARKVFEDKAGIVHEERLHRVTVENTEYGVWLPLN